MTGDTKTDICVRDGDLEWDDLDGGIWRKILTYEARVMMARIRFQAGAVGAAHAHPHLQCSYVESGCFDLTVEGRTERLNAGDSFLIPSGKVHGVVAVTDGILVDVFAPMRRDFLDQER